MRHLLIFLRGDPIKVIFSRSWRADWVRVGKSSLIQEDIPPTLNASAQEVKATLRAVDVRAFDIVFLCKRLPDPLEILGRPSDQQIVNVRHDCHVPAPVTEEAWM